MSTLPSGRYQLKSLHEEIALFDRKLAHLHKYETFASEIERVASADKLTAKRNLLIRKAQQMIDEGIEFNELERPQSLRAVTEKTDVAEKPSHAAEDGTSSGVAVETESSLSLSTSGTLDIRQAVEEYKKNRIKRKTA